MRIKIFEKKKKFKKGGIHLDPNIYWAFCISLVFLIIFFFFGFGFYFFKKINKERGVNVDNSAISSKLNKERIDKVLEYFSTREQKSTEILNSPSPVVDPSL